MLLELLLECSQKDTEKDISQLLHSFQPTFLSVKWVG